jgi:hypothetical protein
VVGREKLTLMTSIHEIQQVMYVTTPHGDGVPLFIIDYGPQVNTIWVVANCDDGRIRHYDSNDIVLTKNNTLKNN